MDTWPIIVFLSFATLILASLVWIMSKQEKGKSQAITLFLLLYGVISSTAVIFLVIILHFHSFYPQDLHLHLWPTVSNKLMFDIGNLRFDVFSMLIVGLTLSILILMLTKSQYHLRKTISLAKDHNDGEMAMKLKNDFHYLKDIELYVIGDATPIAFSFTLLKPFSTPKVVDYLIISKGMIGLLDEDELSTVLAHEYAHISSQDTRYAHLIVTLSTTFRFDPILWLFRKIIDQRHEFSADEGAVELTNKPKSLASSLFKMLELSHTVKPERTFIGSNKKLIIRRIDRLLQMAKSST